MPTVATETITGANTSDGYITITQEEYDQLLKYKELEEIREIVETYYYKDVDEALFFVRKVHDNNWSRDVLLNFIYTDLYGREIRG